MRKYILMAVLAAMALTGCRKTVEPKVMARTVPERADDFVFENNLIAGRFYGKALPLVWIYGSSSPENLSLTNGMRKPWKMAHITIKTMAEKTATRWP